VDVAAGFAKAALACGAGAVSLEVGRRLLVALSLGRVAVRRAHDPEARGRDHVAHRHSSSVASMELKALNQPGIRESLEPPLCRCDGPISVEPAMDLAR
jgi:hypothetical protein